MDESLQRLEDELKSLRVRDPSPQLVDRLTNELAAETESLTAPVRHYATATILGTWKWSGWHATGLAAALVMGAAMILWKFKPSPQGNSPATASAPAVAVAPRDTYQPVAAVNVLYDFKDEGVVKITDEVLARRVRARYIDTYTWRNPRNNASLKWTVPRDEIRVLPASLIQN